MLPVAHRTPPSTERCRALANAGARVFEVDVQVGPHGVLVSHYLPAPMVGRWVEHDGWRFRRVRPVPVDVRLVTLLDHVPDGCRVLLDPKETVAHRRRLLRERLLDELPDRDRFLVSTADPDDLDGYRAAGFGTWRTIGDRGQLARVLAGPELPDEGVSLSHQLATVDSMEQLRRRAALIVTWTVNDHQRASELAALGVGGITTDRIDVLRWTSQQVAGLEGT
jgi:glycerophosphoryl diester phosphodiesterase